MHAVIVSVTVNDGEAATTQLRNEIVPRVKQAPGFVAGYWVGKEDQGTGVVVFESEDAARAALEQAGAPPDEVASWRAPRSGKSWRTPDPRRVGDSRRWRPPPLE